MVLLEHLIIDYRKKVYLYDIEGNYIREFPSISEAQKELLELIILLYVPAVKAKLHTQKIIDGLTKKKIS